MYNLHIFASTKIRNYIKTFEKLMLNAYLDIAGKWTIGYGSLDMPNGDPVKKSDKITNEECEALFNADILTTEYAIKRYTNVGLNQNQFDALVSFIFNCGSGAYQTSTLRKKINLQDFVGAGNEFVRWNKIFSPTKGKYILSIGLTNRRKKEAEIFNTLPDIKIPINYLDNIKAKGLMLISPKLPSHLILDPDLPYTL